MSIVLSITACFTIIGNRKYNFTAVLLCWKTRLLFLIGCFIPVQLESQALIHYLFGRIQCHCTLKTWVNTDVDLTASLSGMFPNYDSSSSCASLKRELEL